MAEIKTRKSLPSTSEGYAKVLDISERTTALLELYSPEDILDSFKKRFRERGPSYVTSDDLEIILDLHRLIVARDVFEGLRNYYEEALLENCRKNTEDGMKAFLAENKILERLSRLESGPPSEKVVIIEEIDKETAKNRVCEYMKKHKKADTEELMENLRMDLRLLVEIIDELKEEGRLKDAEV